MRAAFVLAILTVTACGPTATPTVVAPKPPPPAPPKPVKPAESPARWVLLPSGSVTADARLPIEGVGTLYVGRSGDRWLEKKGGGLVSAETLVPQSVRGVVRDDGGRYAFVGTEGDVFFAKDPLGPIVETRASKSKLRSVAVGKRAIVGIADNALVRSTDFGTTWSPVTTPKTTGSLMQVAMLGEEGLLLAAPQRVLATEDDGATWQAIATPGVGARRVVADANGELMLEGLTASAMLRRSPLRLEKVPRAPTSGWDLPATELTGALLGSDAIYSGAGAIVGERYYEAVQDADQPEHWKLAIAELGKPPVMKSLSILDRCDRVYVTGRDSNLLLACTNTQTTPGPKTKWGPPASYSSTAIKLFKSSDSGATFKDDGLVIGSDRDKLMWVGPDGLVLLDGACKRTRNDWECSESPPLVRPPGGKAFAKAVSAPGIRFDHVAFGPNSTAFALGTDPSSRPSLFFSKDGGRDFARRALPPVMDDRGDAHVPSGTGSALGVDDTGVYVIVRSDRGRLLRYAGAADGSALKGQVLERDFDSFDLSGRRGFGYEIEGTGYETADGGATWTKVGAPVINSSVPIDRLVSCGTYGCVIGDRATRVGWELALGTVGNTGAPPTAKKSLSRTPLRCSADGEWKPLPGVSAASTSNADLGGPSRWVLARRDPQKGALAAVLGSYGAKGLELKEVPLFGPGPVDAAGTITMQVEGVAALRYTFKRDKSASPLPPPPPPKKPPIGGKMPMPIPMPSYTKVPAITPKQMVDVEVAWWVAATGKVHHATIKGVGPLDPVRDVVDGRELASTARTSMLSIAAGGIHVRPFASMGPDAPLYWVSDAGKVEKLSWPEVPNKDIRGRNLPIRLDAARVGGRSVVFGDVGGGLQLFLAWANPNGTSWETRAWGLWPEPDQPTDLYLRFVESSDKPVVGVLAKTKTSSTGWAFPIGSSVQNDPDAAVPLPTLDSTADPPKACGKTPGPWRVLAPWSTGTRHPMIVSVDGRELALATSNAIVRTGPAGDTCVSALDAQTVTTSTFKPTSSEWYSAILHPDDLGHAALFKSTWKSGIPNNEMSVRTMSCSFTPGPLPEGFSTVPGFAE